jgi:AraC-like DNA-binding protein
LHNRILDEFRLGPSDNNQDARGHLENFRQEPVSGSKTEALPKGVLDPALAAQRLRLGRYPPAADLAHFVEYFWVVEWDLRGQEPHVQKTLPYPCVHLVFEADKTAIFGVPQGVFERKLEGAARAFGVRFRPGGFRGVLGGPVLTITDRIIPLTGIYDFDAGAAEAEVLGAAADAEMIGIAERLLRTRIPAPDDTVDLVHGIVDRIANDRDINRVDELAAQLNLSERALQRLFNDYVGVSPKWVIRRSRLHDAAARLANAEDLNLTQLAADLGYSDQAHFTRDFKALVGRSPSDYRRSAAGAG